MNTFKRWLKRNPMEAAMCGLAVVVAILNSGGLVELSKRQTMQRAIVAQNEDQVQAQELLQDKQKELQKIANQRYDDGCQMVLSVDVKGNYKVLSLNTPVLDGNVAPQWRNVPRSKLPLSAVLPANSTVCDAYGNTAILEPDATGFPVVLTIAATTDRVRIEKAMAKVRARRAEVLK